MTAANRKVKGKTVMPVLCSDGSTGEKLIPAVRPCTPKYKTAALAVTADDIYREKDCHVGRCAAGAG